MLSPIAHKEEHIIGNINKNELDGRAVKSFEGTCTTFQSLKLELLRERCDQQTAPLLIYCCFRFKCLSFSFTSQGHVSSFIQFLS